MATILPLLVAALVDWRAPAELLAELSHDRIAVRDRAAADLYRRGEELRGFLLEARDSAPAMEPRARISEILRRLDADARIRDFGGWNRVSGFAASLRSDRFFGSGPFRLSLDVMNVGPRDQEFPGLGTLDLELPDQDLRSAGADARLSIRRFISTGLRRTTWSSGERGLRTPALLRPGDCVRFEVEIPARSLPAGDFDVEAEIFARELLPGAEESLRSNRVRLMVRN